mgnify:FL=1|tara:strand:- start:650 stop:1024 length:375 start_codon:yes stop_codon:yes gene_type:complete
MATRATYCIQCGNHSTLTLYIHWDGYPEGAANYFDRALNLLENPRGSELLEKASFEACFLIANPKAEVTRSHEQHADTDYRYNIFRKGSRYFVEWQERKSCGKGFQIINTLPMREFIDRFGVAS